jgi:ketosteroid isomerase-like protein
LKSIIVALLAFAVGAVVAFVVAGGSGGSSGISPQQMADTIHIVLEADRTVYTKKIVNRLVNEEDVIKASEHWEDDKALLLPAQMFREGSELVQKQTSDFSYALLSLWPINSQNKPKTPAEEEGLQAVVDNANQPFYKEETLGDKRYFTAVYPDVAVAEACVSCHNEHKDSPKTDFELGETMGGVVIRIPLDS